MKPTTPHYGAALFGLAFLGLSACDSQASTDYQGEALLTLKGSVTLGETSLEGPLVPALVFGDPDGTMELMDVGVSGDFPAGFTLDVFAPPFASCVRALAPFQGEPRGAVAYITAVRADHPSSFRVGLGPSSSGSCSVGYGVPCELDTEWCTKSGECRREHHVCPGLDEYLRAIEQHDFTGCVLTEDSGDPELAIDPFSRLAGLSENYLVLYLEQEAPADSFIAHAYSGDGAIPAGYNLIEVTRSQPTIDEIGADNMCQRAAEALAVERTMCTNGESSCPQWREAYARALVDLDCPLGDLSLSLRRVVDPASTSLQVRIGQDLSLADRAFWWFL